MEATLIDFILSTLMSLSARYPDAAWLVTATVKAEVKAVTGK